MGNNGYRANWSWLLTSVIGLVLPSAGAVSPAMVSSLASASPSRSVTSSPTASQRQFKQVASCVPVTVVDNAAIGTVPFPCTAEVSVHDSASGAGLAAGKPLVGFQNAGAVPSWPCTVSGPADWTLRRRPAPWDCSPAFSMPDTLRVSMPRV